MMNLAWALLLTVAPSKGLAQVWAETAVVSAKADVAGKEAGKKLKDACAGRTPDLVLVFQFKWSFKSDEERQQVLDGVAESFDRKIICGHQTGPLNGTGGKGGNIGMMALGGEQAPVVNEMMQKG